MVLYRSLIGKSLETVFFAAGVSHENIEPLTLAVEAWIMEEAEGGVIESKAIWEKVTTEILNSFDPEAAKRYKKYRG